MGRRTGWNHLCRQGNDRPSTSLKKYPRLLVKFEKAGFLILAALGAELVINNQHTVALRSSARQWKCAAHRLKVAQLDAANEDRVR